MRPPSPSRPQKPKNFQQPKVVFQPEAAEGMQAGITKLVHLISPTLGPLPHAVAHEKIAQRDKLPELLDSGGTIARRVIQIADRDEDVGLMFLRHVLWKLQESEGDGTATAAVMFQHIYNQGRRYLIAGGNPMGLRRHFENGMIQVMNGLDNITVQLSGKQKLAGLARTICYDADLSKMLGEIFDIIGAYGRLEVRKGTGGELVREYVEGMYWDNGYLSRDMANSEHGTRANLENAAVLISDLEIDTPEALVPLLQLAVKNNIKQILLISQTLSEKAMGIILSKANRERVHVVAVRTPGMASDVQRDAIADLAILTGGQALVKAAGDKLENVRLEHLGRARRIWADKDAFGIIGGRGNPRQLRQHIADLRLAYRGTSDADDRKRLLERLGKLTGGSATLYVGGLSPNDIEARVELAKRTSEAMRGAMREGVVPGGGIALLACRDILRPFVHTEDTDQRAAYRIMIEALEAPFRTLVTNAGYQPGNVLAEIEQCGPGYYGLDVLARKVTDMREAAIFDAAPVVKAAVRSAFGSAALVLTTEAIVHRKNPPEGLHT
jgi:chaperonin GroEL